MSQVELAFFTSPVLELIVPEIPTRTVSFRAVSISISRTSARMAAIVPS
jgi:hypothetical protein